MVYFTAKWVWSDIKTATNFVRFAGLPFPSVIGEEYPVSVCNVANVTSTVGHLWACVKGDTAYMEMLDDGTVLSAGVTPGVNANGSVYAAGWYIAGPGN
jgi:hypothetical protein